MYALVILIGICYTHEVKPDKFITVILLYAYYNIY